MKIYFKNGQILKTSDKIVEFLSEKEFGKIKKLEWENKGKTILKYVDLNEVIAVTNE